MRNGGQLRKAIDATLSDRNAFELIFSGGIVSHLESEMQFMPFVTVETWNLMVPIAEIVQVFSSLYRTIRAEFAFGKTMAVAMPGEASTWK